MTMENVLITCDDLCCSEYQRLKTTSCFESDDCFLTHLLTLEGESREFPRVSELMTLHLKRETVQKFRQMKTTSAYEYADDHSFLQHLLGLEKHRVTFYNLDNLKPPISHAVIDSNGVDCSALEIIAAGESDVKFSSNCQDSEQVYDGIDANSLETLDQDQKTNLSDSTQTSTSSSAMRMAAIKLANFYKLKCSLFLNDDGLEIVNEKSYCHPYNDQTFGTYPAKCFVRNGEARMYWFNKPVGEVVTACDKELDQLIAQLATYSKYFACNGIEPVLNLEPNYGDRYHAKQCMFWYQRNTNAKHFRCKDGGNWCIVCPKCVQFRTNLEKRCKEDVAVKDVTNPDTCVALATLTRPQLEQRYKMLKNYYDRIRRNTARLKARLKKDVKLPENGDNNGVVSEIEDFDDVVVPQPLRRIRKKKSVSKIRVSIVGSNYCGISVDDTISDVIKNGDGSEEIREGRASEPTNHEAGEHVQTDYTADCDPMSVPNSVSGLSEALAIKVEPDLATDSELIPADHNVKTEDNIVEGPRTSSEIFVSFPDPEDLGEVEPGEKDAEKCSECNKCFKDKLSLQIHRKHNHNKLDYVCPLCDQWFESQQILDFHIGFVHKTGKPGEVSKSIVCNGCGQTNAVEIRSYLHKRRVHELFECIQCEFACRSLPVLKNHRLKCQVVRRSLIECPICLHLFSDQRLLRKHKGKAHNIHQCSRCREEFEGLEKLAAHQAIGCKRRRSYGKGRFRCRKCGVRLTTEHSLTLHLENIHALVICKTCDKLVIYGKVKEHKQQCEGVTYDCSKCSEKNCDSKAGCICLPQLTEKRTYECSHCKEVVTSIKKLKAHLRESHNQSLPDHKKTCKICGKAVVDLKGHLRQHSAVRSFNCAYCPLKFKFKQGLNAHYYRIHPQNVEEKGGSIPPYYIKYNQGAYKGKNLEVQYACFDCGFTAAGIADVEAHIDIHSYSGAECKFCEGSFETEKLLEHMKAHIPMVHKCKRCSFVGLGKPSGHYQGCGYEGRLPYGSEFHGFQCDGQVFYRCKHCGKSTDGLGSPFNSSTFKRHLRIVHKRHFIGNKSNDRMVVGSASQKSTNKIAMSHKCGSCDFVCSTASGVKQHFVVKHAGCAVCAICGSVLGSRISLRNHMNVVHDSEKSKLIECDICLKMIPSSRLYNHKYSHRARAVGRYKCSYCPKVFKASSNRTAHEGKHTGVKKYLCKTCGKRFSYKPNFNVHLNTHLKIRPFICDVCAKGFNEKRALQRHFKAHHPG